jgi:hypothetical protein
MYGKFFTSAFTGSMMGKGSHVFAVWAYVIAHTVDSQVELNPRYLAAVIGETPERIEEAIAYLCAPDPQSRSKLDDGRRLVREGQFAYRVPTHERYRSIRNEDERREYNRIKKAESRARSKMSLTVNDGHQCQPKQKQKQKQKQKHGTAMSPEGDEHGEKPTAPPAPSGDVERVLAHYRAVHPKRRPSDKDRRIVERALKRYPAGDLCLAIDGNAADPWHRERHKHELEYVLRDGKIDTHIAKAAAVAVPLVKDGSLTDEGERLTRPDGFRAYS